MKRRIAAILLCLLACSSAYADTHTISDAGGNWDTVGAWVEGAVPEATDDVVAQGDGTSGNLVVNSATAALNSFDLTNYTGTLSGSSDITVTVASGTSTVLFAGTSPTWSGVLNLNPAAGTTINLTGGTLATAGTCGGITVAGTTTGAVFMLDGWTIGATKTVTLTSGTLHTDGADDAQNLTHSWGLFNSSNSNTRTLTLGTSTIEITKSGIAWYINDSTNLTLSANTAAITLSGADAGGYFGGKIYGGTIAFTGSGTAYVTNSNSFANFTRTGTNAKTNSFRVNDGQTITGILTVNGNSATNRVLVYGWTLGTANTLTVTGATVSTNNVDFRDITFARTDASGLDLTNGGANLIGDCGGNSRTGGDGTVTFSTPVTTTCTGASANWSAATWDVRMPLPQDTAVLSLTAGQTLTVDEPRLCTDISFGTACNLTLGNAVTSYGSVDLTTCNTFSGAYNWTFESQARSGTNTLTSNGKSFPNTVTIQAVGATLQLADAANATSYFALSNGTFIDAGFSLTSTRFITNSGVTRVVTKTGNWTLNLTAANTILDTSTANLTWSDTAGTITISDTGANAKTFAGANRTFYNLSCPAGTGGVIITGSNTFNNITVAAGGTLTVTAGTTQTLNSLTATGTSGSRITLASATPASNFQLTDADGGKNLCDYLDVTDCHGHPDNTFYCGANGTMDAYSDSNGWDRGAAGPLRYNRFLLPQ